MTTGAWRPFDLWTVMMLTACMPSGMGTFSSPPCSFHWVRKSEREMMPWDAQALIISRKRFRKGADSSKRLNTSSCLYHSQRMS